MDMSILEFIYFVCFFLGLGFAVLSGLMSGVFSGGAEGHIDTPGGEVELGTPDPSGPGTFEGQVHFSPLSPVTIALFVSTFGGTGLILDKVFHWPWPLQLPVAGVSGAVAGLGLAWVFYKVMRGTQSTSHGRARDVIGLEAEVTVPIPHQGLGEVAYTLNNSRLTNPARTADGKELPARSSVKIVKQVGTTYIVEKA